MSIQYSGGPNINSTFLGDTKTNIVTRLSAALVNAGWTVTSGGGTGVQTLRSAVTTAPSSLQCYVNLYDTNTNCAAVQFRNVVGDKVMYYMPLLPSAGRTFRVIANPYQFFCFSQDSMAIARTMASGGVPYLPTFLQGVITEMIWCQGNARSDSDGATINHWRVNMYTGFYQQYNGSWYPNSSWLINGVLTSYPFNDQNFSRGLQFLTVGHPNHLYCNYICKWHDDSVLVYEPLILCGSPDPYNYVNLIRGQLWDCALINGSYTPDQILTYDARSWWMYTSSNWGGSNSSNVTSLMLYVP